MNEGTIFRRTLSRLSAVQILYTYFFLAGNRNIEDVSRDFIESYAPKISGKNKDFMMGLVRNTLEHLETIDAIIIDSLKDRETFEKMDDVLKQILRLGVYELKYSKEVDSSVIITEYIHVTEMFFDEKQVRFINGMLDKAGKEVR